MTQAGSGAAEQADPPAVTGPFAGTGPSADTGPSAPDAASPEVPARRGPVSGFRAGLVMAVVFTLGLASGAVVVGLLGDSAPSPVAGRADADADDGGLIAVDLDPGAGPFQVNGACLGAFNAAQDAYTTMGDLGQAAAAVDAAQLDEVVRRLQPLQRQLEDDLSTCQVSELDERSGDDRSGEDPSEENLDQDADPAPGTDATPGPTAPIPSPTD